MGGGGGREEGKGEVEGRGEGRKGKGGDPLGLVHTTMLEILKIPCHKHVSKIKCCS